MVSVENDFCGVCRDEHPRGSDALQTRDWGLVCKPCVDRIVTEHGSLKEFEADQVSE